MLRMDYHETSQGKRSENLDIVGHVSGENWSFSYLLDGFPEMEPHYVHALSNTIKDELVINCENPIDTINMLMKKVDGLVLGKASAVFVICIRNEMKIYANGDSRAYIPMLSFQTKDHTLLQEHINNGRLKGSDAHTHILFDALRNRLTKSIGPGSGLDDMVIQYDGGTQDVWICSDGFWSELLSLDLMLIHSKENLKKIFNTTNYKDNATVAYLKLK